MRSGLTVAVAGKGTLPSDFRILGGNDGFPELPNIVITLVKSGNQLSQAAEALATYVTESFKDLLKSEFKALSA